MSAGSQVFLLLPILAAGFIFTLTWVRLRFIFATVDGQRLFLAVATSGFIIASISYPVYPAAIACVPELKNLFATYPINYVGESLLVLFFALVFGFVFNAVEYVMVLPIFRGKSGPREWKERIFQRIVRAYGGTMLGFLVDAYERRAMVMITLGSRKVYCGILRRIVPSSPKNEQFVELIPAFSGYRDKDSLKLIISERYDVFDLWRILGYRDVLKALLATKRPESDVLGTDVARRLLIDQVADIERKVGSVRPDVQLALDRIPIEDWVKVIPCSTIETFSLFDEDSYKSLFAENLSGSV